MARSDISPRALAANANFVPVMITFCKIEQLPRGSEAEKRQTVKIRKADKSFRSIGS
jgi:hypothetical protein